MTFFMRTKRVVFSKQSPVRESVVFLVLNPSHPHTPCISHTHLPCPPLPASSSLGAGRAAHHTTTAALAYHRLISQ